METGTVILIVGVGAAGFLFWQSQQKQAAAAAAAQAAAAGAIPATGGGVSGLLQRAVANWQADPLGIQNQKKVIGFVVGAGENAAKSIASGANGVVSSIAHIL